MSLDSTFDFKKYKDPGEYFKAYDRHESKFPSAVFLNL
jgi:hypothetical protein